MTARRVALAVILLAFGYGTVTHSADFVRFGFAPYRFGPPLLNLFWNALVLLDAAVVGLLLAGRRRCGLGAGLAVMIADVAANSYASLDLGIAEFGTALLLQAAFLGFLLGAAPFLWSRGPVHD